jgi:MFS transporter, UMF1 family
MTEGRRYANIYAMKFFSPNSDRKSVWAWCLYDWANTAFGTVILTFIYSVYFAKGIVGDETHAASIWAYAIAISGLVIAVLSPVFGSIADHTGRRKPWIFGFNLICVIATALLWFGMPGASDTQILMILGLVILGNIGFEMAIVFYNAMLPDISGSKNMGRLSGLAWGLGYLGGLSCLVLVLFGVIGLGPVEPLLHLPTENSQHVRAAALLTAGWIFVFSLPLFIFTPDAPRSGLSIAQAVKNGLKSLADTIRHIRGEKNIFTFLVSAAIYRDGLNTLFAIGGLYAAGQYGMSFEQILIFAIGLNVTAGFGAMGFSFLDDKKGSKTVILISLMGLVMTGGVILWVDDLYWFIGLAMLLGIFIGPAQAAGRTLCARLSPPEKVTQIFGFYSLTGKSIAFLGPLTYGLATEVFDTQKAGMVTIIGFWLLGALLLSLVREGQNR